MAAAPHLSASRVAWRNGGPTQGTRLVPEETAIALSYGGTTHAVMMATPCDLEDFAFGFSLNEGVITNGSQITGINIVAVDGGLDIQIDLQPDVLAALKTRRRAMAGPVGCGLCGVESIADALRPVPGVFAKALHLSPDEVADAVQLLASNQPLHAMTHAVHAAGFYVPGIGMAAVREDVGRHNALDKLRGAMARAAMDGACGAVVITSRVSVEIVQKTAACGSSFILAVSAPTALAIRTAQAAGITLAALVRGKDFDVFTHPDRIAAGARAHVA